MDFATAVKTVLTQRYADFNGRSTRPEYWWWVLFAVIASVVLQLVDNIFGFPLLGSLFSLATLVPGIAVGVRRLHDLDKSGWWLLVAFTIIGAFVLLYWFTQEGTKGDNQFGPQPTA